MKRIFLSITPITMMLSLTTQVSAELLFHEDFIYYITGKSNKWELKRISVRSKKKSKLLNFKDLIDIEFSPSGILYENTSGLWFFDYLNNEPERI